MAKSLRHHVVGEGVETAEQMAFLRANGCDEAQGYYLSMPLAAKHFAKLFKPGLGSFISEPGFKSGRATSSWLISDKHQLTN
jgi:predicted signal transduction protein with EAL and GGDEF domain